MGGERITALDVLRGVAILGTLGTNIWIFTDPAGVAAILNGTSSGGVVESLLRMLSNGKFLALLSIMFGIGLALQHASAVRNGARWPGWYLWRSALLLLEGLAHYVLIFEFDVLMFYAIVSVVVAFLVGRSARVQNFWLIAHAALHLALVGLITSVLLTSESTGGGTPMVSATTWLGQVGDRIEFFAMFRVEAVLVLPLSTVLFLAGVRLLRAGALENSDRGRRIQGRLIRWGLGVGLPLNVLTALSGTEWFLVDRYVCAPIVAFGLLGAITAVVNRMRAQAGPMRQGLTSVGQAALSCYVGQNLIASVICQPWGLNLTARLADLRPWWTVGCWLVISAILMVGASWWLRRFSRGPMEALWQWAYQAPQRRLIPVPQDRP